MTDTPVRLEAAHEAEEVLFLRRGQCRGRLVKDDETNVVEYGSGDFNHLPLCGAEIGDDRRGIDVKVERPERGLSVLVERLEAVERLLLPEHDVLRDGHGRDQTGFLVDHDDSVRERVGGAHVVQFLPVEPHLAGRQAHGSGDRLAYCRLPGAVLAEKAEDLTRAHVQVDVADRVNAAVYLAGLPDFQPDGGVGHDIHCCPPASLSSWRSSFPWPLEVMKTVLPLAATPVIPCRLPSTRL